MADARCAQCGGNVAVRLTGPPLSCSYCGSDKPLAPDVAARVETLRVDLERHKGRSQQLLGKQVFAGVVSSSWVLTLLVILWGGVITGAATCEPLPKGHTTFATLSGPRLRATDPTSRALVTKWWLLYLPLTGFTFNLALWSVMRLRGRRVIRAALPRAPRAAGAPLRCRCCAADLPEGGAIRRCAFCDADHVVLGSRYQKEQTSLARELDALQSQVGRTLADRDRTATRVAAIGTWSPLIALLAMPAALFVPRTYPVLWALPASFVALTILMLVLTAAGPSLPRIRSLGALGVGDQIIVDTRRFVAVAAVEVWPTLTFPVVQRLVVLRDARDDTAAPSHAVIVDFDAERDIHSARLFEISEAGTALSARDTQGENALRRYAVERAPDEGWADYQALWIVPTIAANAFNGLRCWAEAPQVGATPAHTLTLAGVVAEEKLTLIGA